MASNGSNSSANSLLLPLTATMMRRRTLTRARPLLMTRLRSRRLFPWTLPTPRMRPSRLSSDKYYVAQENVLELMTSTGDHWKLRAGAVPHKHLQNKGLLIWRAQFMRLSLQEINRHQLGGRAVRKFVTFTLLSLGTFVEYSVCNLEVCNLTYFGAFLSL
ncbi:hypothetical protein I3760_02G049300 [Carya illinoinensis]|nr:hypothetical protein I3760_02G049300 [Carya illinoinensis]